MSENFYVRIFCSFKSVKEVVYSLTNRKTQKLSLLTLSGPGGGGGGLRDPDDQTHSCQSETSYSMTLKLCDF